VQVSETEVTPQCCTTNTVNGVPQLDLAGRIDIIYSDGFLWFTENQGCINGRTIPRMVAPRDR
jgi:hypothetical protein